MRSASLINSVLMSSHRDYETEKDWELLRNDSLYGDALVFEPQAERSSAGAERYEMVVTDRWTSKVCLYFVRGTRRVDWRLTRTCCAVDKDES